MKIKILLLIHIILLSPYMAAQITIGSSYKPEQGAILDMKENDNIGTNSIKGLAIPKVALSSLTELYPMYGSLGSETEEYTQNKVLLKEKHTGLTVYNNNDNTVFAPGFYLWDGERWLVNELITTPAPAIDELLCGAVRMFPSNFAAGTYFRCIIMLPYTGGNGGRYTQFDDGIYKNGIQNGVPIDFKISVASGCLSTGNGEMILIGEGIIPSAADEVTFDVNILGKSCTITINEQIEAERVLSYKSGSFLDVTESNTTGSVIYDNLEVRYNNGYYEYRILNERRDVSLIYRKVGKGGLNYGIYAQNWALKDKWYRFDQSENNGPVKAGSGSNGYKADNANISLQNRDIGIVHIIIHANNIQDVYRVTFNANSEIAENIAKSIPSAKSAVSMIIEKLE